MVPCDKPRWGSFSKVFMPNLLILPGNKPLKGMVILTKYIYRILRRKKT